MKLTFLTVKSHESKRNKYTPSLRNYCFLKYLKSKVKINPMNNKKPLKEIPKE